MDYADKLRPGMNQTKRRLIHDALELESKCGQMFHEKQNVSISKRDLSEESKIPTFYVDSLSGSDKNKGTLESTPLRSFRVALERTRALKAPQRRIVLRDGTHRFNETMKLDSSDSGLIITSYPGEQAVVSGGKLFKNLHWEKEGDKIYRTKLNDSLKEQLQGGDMLSLHHRGQRVTLARYPNANPELDLFPIGYITSETSWKPPVNENGEICDPNSQCGVSENITLPATDAWHGMYQNYSVGRGGACDRYEPNYSPWCSGEFYLLRQFPEMHTRSPSGIDNALEALPNAPYVNARSIKLRRTPRTFSEYNRYNSSEFYIHAWRPGHWYTWMFKTNETTPPTHVKEWTIMEDTNAVFGQVPQPKGSTDSIVYLGEFDDENECWSACNKSSTCHGFAYHTPDFDASFAKQCYELTSPVWNAQAEDKVVSGRGPHISGGSITFGMAGVNGGGHQGGEGNDQGGEWFVRSLIFHVSI